MTYNIEANHNYTPTFTSVLNLTSVSENGAMYMKLGDLVIMGIQFDAELAGTGAGVFDIDLPIASNFSNRNDAAGAGANDAATDDIGWSVFALTATNKLRVRIYSDTASRSYRGLIQYRIR